MIILPINRIHLLRISLDKFLITLIYARPDLCTWYDALLDPDVRSLLQDIICNINVPLYFNYWIVWQRHMHYLNRLGKEILDESNVRIQEFKGQEVCKLISTQLSGPDFINKGISPSDWSGFGDFAFACYPPPTTGPPRVTRLLSLITGVGLRNWC